MTSKERMGSDGDGAWGFSSDDDVCDAVPSSSTEELVLRTLLKFYRPLPVICRKKSCPSSIGVSN